MLKIAAMESYANKTDALRVRKMKSAVNFPRSARTKCVSPAVEQTKAARQGRFVKTIVALDARMITTVALVSCACKGLARWEIAM